jgi:hypothetical protein
VRRTLPRKRRERRQAGGHCCLSLLLLVHIHPLFSLLLPLEPTLSIGHIRSDVREIGLELGQALGAVGAKELEPCLGGTR